MLSWTSVFLVTTNIYSSASPEAIWKTNKVWNLFLFALFTIFFCPVYSRWEVRVIQICLTHSDWLVSVQIQDCCSICYCLLKMKQTPETPFEGNFKNTSLKISHLASAYGWEAETERRITPDKQFLKPSYWIGKSQTYLVQGNDWAHANFEECYWPQSWCIFSWTSICPQTSHRYLFAVLENFKNLVYFYIDKLSMKIAHRLNFIIRRPAIYSFCSSQDHRNSLKIIWY